MISRTYNNTPFHKKRGIRRYSFMSLAAEAAEPLAKGAEVTAECKEIAHYVEPPFLFPSGDRSSLGML